MTDPTPVREYTDEERRILAMNITPPDDPFFEGVPDLVEEPPPDMGPGAKFQEPMSFTLTPAKPKE